MRVIKKARKAREIEVACRNERCQAVLGVTEDDAPVQSDRDGAYRIIKCPECGQQNYVAASRWEE